MTLPWGFLKGLYLGHLHIGVGTYGVVSFSMHCLVAKLFFPSGSFLPS